MSHWQAGKVELNCSLSLLRKALIEIVEEWKDSIVISENGDIPIYNYQGKRDNSTYHLMVAGVGNPSHKCASGMVYSDLGITKNDNGTWDIKVDEAGLPRKAKNLSGKLKAAVAISKVKSIANSGTNRKTAEYSKNGKKYIRMVAPVKDKHKIQA